MAKSSVCCIKCGEPVSGYHRYSITELTDEYDTSIIIGHIVEHVDCANPIAQEVAGKSGPVFELPSNQRQDAQEKIYKNS